MRSMVVLLGAVLCALVAGEARAQADGGFYVSQGSPSVSPCSPSRSRRPRGAARLSFHGLVEPVDSVREVTRERGQTPEGRALYIPPAPVAMMGAPERSEAGGFRVQRGNDPIWDGALKGFAVGAGPLLAVYAYAWKHEGEAPTVKGGPAALAAAVGLFGGIGALIGVGVDRRHSQTPEFHLAPMEAGASLSIAW